MYAVAALSQFTTLQSKNFSQTIMRELQYALTECFIKINQGANPGEVLEQDLFNYTNESKVSHYL